jgi:hypothetical protein
MRWAEHATRMRIIRNTYGLLVRNAEGMRQLVRLRRRWIDDNKKNSGEIEADTDLA